MNFLTFDLSKVGHFLPKKHFKHYVLASIYSLIYWILKAACIWKTIVIFSSETDRMTKAMATKN